MIKIGSIGSGSIIRNILSQMNRIEGYELVSFYSRDINKAREFKEEFNIKYATSNIDDLFNSEEINTIYIASPNSLHFTQAKRALLSGKNVICEKPITSRKEELVELIEIAREKNLIIFEAIANIYLPILSRIKEEMGNIGKISSVIINFSQYSSKYDRYLNGDIPNVFNSEFSGGALADIGIYNIHLVYSLFNMPKKLHYFSNVNKYGVDMAGVASFKYDDFIVSFTCAKDTFSKNFIDIQGDKGFIYLDGTLQGAGIMTLYKDKKESIIYINEENIYEYELRHFLENFNDPDNFIGDNENSIRVMEIFEELKRSSNIKDSLS